MRIVAIGARTSTLETLIVDDTESWKTHEFQEYGVHHEFECVADHRRREWQFGSIRPITSLKRDTKLIVSVRKFDSAEDSMLRITAARLRHE